MFVLDERQQPAKTRLQLQTSFEAKERLGNHHLYANGLGKYSLGLSIVFVQCTAEFAHEKSQSSTFVREAALQSLKHALVYESLDELASSTAQFIQQVD